MDERFTRANVAVENIPLPVRQKILDQAKTAQDFLDNNPLAILWIQHRLALVDEVRSITTYSVEDEKRRLAITYKIAGLDSFIDFLQELILLAKKVNSINDPSASRTTRGASKPTVAAVTAIKPVINPEQNIADQ